MANRAVEDDRYPYSRKYKSKEFEIYKFGDKETYELMVYECGREKCTPSHSFDEIRNRYLIHFVLKGKGTYTVNGKVHHLTANQGFVVRMGEEYEYCADAEDPWEYVWVGFNGTQAKILLRNAGLLDEDVFSTKVTSKVVTCFLNMIEGAETNLGSQYLLLGELYILLSYLIDERNSGKKYSDERSVVREAVDYIVNNYSHQINISDIAERLNYDRTSLYRKFVSETGKSPQEFLIEYRLIKAKQDLKFSKLSTLEVCYACGFNNYSHFSTLFSKRIGMSPVKYRETNGGKWAWEETDDE